MSHYLVDQLRFARSEFHRGLFDVNEENGAHRLKSMNAIGWTIGHLAWQEERYWLRRARQVILNPRLDAEFAYGRPPTTPSITEMWESWDQVIAAADDWLDDLDETRLAKPLADGFSNVGTFILRTTYHYWYHLGEGLAVRQMLGHTGLPDFVGDIDNQAPWPSLSD